VDYTLVPSPVPLRRRAAWRGQDSICNSGLWIIPWSLVLYPRGEGPPGVDRTPSATLVCGLYLGPWSCTPEKEGRLARTGLHLQLWSVDYTLVPGPVSPMRRAAWRGQDSICNFGLWIIPWSLVPYPRGGGPPGTDKTPSATLVCGLYLGPWSCSSNEEGRLAQTGLHL
jgi:hypothetical protein